MHTPEAAAVGRELPARDSKRSGGRTHFACMGSGRCGSMFEKSLADPTARPESALIAIGFQAHRLEASSSAALIRGCKPAHPTTREMHRNHIVRCPHLSRHGEAGTPGPIITLDTD